MRGRNYIFTLIIIMIFSFSFNVCAKEYDFYIDSTCTKNDKECFTSLDSALELVDGDKTKSSDTIDLIIIDSEVSFSHSYTINGKLKFVIDDVGNKNTLTFNGNNNTITTNKYIEFTGNAQLNISNLNIKDSLADAREDSFTLGIYSQVVNLNSISVSSLKYMGIMAGQNGSDYDFEGVQVSGAETGIDFYGKNFNINNCTVDDNTIGFSIGGSEGLISNSKINSIRSYDKAIVKVDSSNTLVDNPLKFFVNDNKSKYLDIDLDNYFVISNEKDSIVKMDLIKDSNIVINDKNNKIDILKLFNGIEEVSLDNIVWKSSNDKIISIKDNYVLLLKEGDAKVSGVIPFTNTKLTVKFHITKERDKSLLGTIKYIISNPKTYSLLFIMWLIVFVITCTILSYNKRRHELELKDII